MRVFVKVLVCILCLYPIGFVGLNLFGVSLYGLFSFYVSDQYKFTDY